MTQSSRNDRKDDMWMREAANIAIENVDRGGGPFGAIIVRNDTIIGRGANSVTSNLDPTAHAEVTVRFVSSRV